MNSEGEIRSFLTEMIRLDLQKSRELVASHPELASDTALDHLKSLLSDPYLKGGASYVLTLIGNPKAISILEEQVVEPMWKSTLSGIVGAKNQLALKIMLLAVTHQYDNYDVISYFEECVEELGEEAIDFCLDYLENPDAPDKAKDRALDALSLIQSERIMGILTKIALDPSSHLQSSAIYNLGYMIGEKILKPLHDQLASADPDVAEAIRYVFTEWKKHLPSE